MLDARVTRPFAEMRDHGLLWLINKVVFHPRGFALAVQVEDDGTVTGWGMLGDGSEPWQYAPEVEDEQFARVEAFLGSMRARGDEPCPVAPGKERPERAT